jgi:hypothetical protein
MWQHEMGPNGGDEINVLKPGANYGWPIVSYGRSYPGPWQAPKLSHETFEQPLVAAYDFDNYSARGSKIGGLLGFDLIKEFHLLARSIFVVDSQGKIQYIQLVKEIASEPDYNAVLDAVKKIK